ncbi:hypothetical protein KO516_21970 [Citreicella sp. C3M06]|nr:hypothetical protein [Citreicella sp. C3M06]MBU2963443.1 hypothetical protein [Citreicella sp. C3M06]
MENGEQGTYLTTGLVAKPCALPLEINDLRTGSGPVSRHVSCQERNVQK